LFFYNLDQIACVGACVGKVKKQAGSSGFALFKKATGFLLAQGKTPAK